jgi:hypothetical protein
MFDNLSTSSEVKSEYRRLIEIAVFAGTETADVDEAYLNRLEELNGQVTTGADGKEHTYRFNPNVEKQTLAVLQTLLAMQMDNVKIELVGTWVWASGNTRPHKENLKKAGLIWHGKRKRWYHRVRGGPRKYSGLPFAAVRKMHGSQEYEAEKKKPNGNWGQF